MTTGNNKVDGSANAGESLVGDLDFFTISIANGTFRSDAPAGSHGRDEAGDPVDIEQYLFDRMIEVISQRGQPVLLTGGGVGGGKTSFKFAVEHSTMWSESGAANAGEGAAIVLKDELDTTIKAITNDAGTPVYSGTFTATVTFAETL